MKIKIISYKDSRQYKERGTITVLLAIIIPAILFMSLGIAEYSKYLQVEAKCNRLCNLYGDTVLSNYDRELLDRYGIYAFEDCEKILFNFEENLVSEDVDAEIFFLKSSPLSDKLELERQISIFTRARLLPRILSEIKERNKFFNDFIKTNKEKASSFRDIIKNINNISKEIINKKKGKPKIGKNSIFLTRYNENNTVEIKQPSDDSSIEVKDNTLKEDSNDNLERKEAVNNLEHFLNEIKEIDNHDKQIKKNLEIEGDTSSLLSGIVKIIDQFEEFLSKDLSTNFDKMFISEYILNQFSSRMRGPSGADKEFRTLSGQNMSDLNFASECEAEMAILGMSNEFWAKFKIDSVIIMTRLLSNYIKISTDTTLLSTYRSLAIIVSSALSLISMGALVIPPEVITQIFIFVNAIKDSYFEYKEILKGKSISVYNSNTSKVLKNIKLNYVDYLRFISLFIPREKQLESIAKTIFMNIDRDFYYRIQINLRYKTPLWTKEINRYFAYENY